MNEQVDGQGEHGKNDHLTESTKKDLKQGD